MVLGSDGSEVDWHVGYGPPPEKFLERLEKSVKGIDTFKSLSDRYKKDAKNVEVVFKLAQKYDDRYDEEKALEFLNNVLALDPKGKKGTTEYDGQKVSYTEYTEFSIGTLKIYSRNRDAEPLKAFIKKYPDSKMLKSAYQYLGSFYGFSGTKEEAMAFFEDSISRWPDDPYVLSSYVSRIIRDKQNLDKGIKLSEKINDIMKYNPDSRYQRDLAELYVLKEDKAKADEIYGKRYMDGQVSRLASNLRNYAEFWAKQNTNLESAEEMIGMALKLRPDSWSYAQSAAKIYLQLKREDKALQVFGHEFVKQNIDKSDLLSYYARFWAGEKKNLDSALDAAQKAVDVYPTDFKWDTLAQVLLKLEKFEEALKAAENAVNMADKEMKVRYENTIKQIKKAMEEKKKEEKQ